MKIYFLFAFLAIQAITEARHGCTKVSDCFPYCQEPGNIPHGVREAFCLNNVCSCGEPIEICFSEADCYSHCGIKDPSLPRDKNPVCTENGHCECVPVRS